ncbi:MAG: CvpA family protein [Methylococcales bacterium]|nr:CvpA family protein [Methylococcales bacterium]
MNEIDYAIIIILVISLLIGILRGLVKEILSLLAWVVAIWVGLTFSRPFSILFETVIDFPAARIATAFIVLLICTLIVSGIVNYFAELLLEKTGLTGVDRFLGFFLGVARGGIVVALLIMLAGLTPVPELALWKDSTLIPYFLKLALWLREQIPPEIAEMAT